MKPDKADRGKLFPCCGTTIPLLSNYCLWSILNLFESRWREGHIFNIATRHINVFRNYSFYVSRIYVFGVEIQIWSCKHVADVEKMDTRHHQRRFWIQRHERLRKPKRKNDKTCCPRCDKSGKEIHSSFRQAGWNCCFIHFQGFEFKMCYLKAVINAQLALFKHFPIMCSPKIYRLCSTSSWQVKWSPVVLNRNENLQTVCCNFSMLFVYQPNRLPYYFPTFLAFCTSLCRSLLFELSTYSLRLSSVVTAEGDKAPETVLVQLRLLWFGSSRSLFHQHFVFHGMRTAAIVCFITTDTSS